MSEYRDQVLIKKKVKRNKNDFLKQMTMEQRLRNLATQKRHQNTHTSSVIPYPRIGKRDKEIFMK